MRNFYEPNTELITVENIQNAMAPHLVALS